MDTTDSFEDAPDPERRRRSWARPPLVAAVVLGLLAAALGGYALVQRRSVGGATAGAVVTESDLEDRYGVRIDLVALTALGGLLQLRFTVLDKDKADPLFHDDKPHLLIEDSGTDLAPPKDTAHKMTLLNGASYFLFYANADNVAKTGRKVSVVVDGVRVEHLEIRS